MKSKAIKMSVLALGLAASVSGFAATQGVAGATSTGSFTNTFGGVSATQVRVFGLQDATMNASSGTVFNGYLTSPGVTDRFCVAHANGGSVRLTFSSDGITRGWWDDGRNLLAKSQATGEEITYHMWVAKVGTTPSGDANLIRKSTPSHDIANAQTDLVNCTTPNVAKGIFVGGNVAWDPANTKVYTDVVTVTASPI